MSIRSDTEDQTIGGSTGESSAERRQRVRNLESLGVLLFETTGTLIDCNDEFLRMTGYTRDQVTSKSLPWRDMTPPEHVAESEAQMAEHG